MRRISWFTVTGAGVAASAAPGRSPSGSRPISIAALIAPTLTTSYSIRLMLRKPCSFGIRMWIGVWPPSNQAGIELPARDFWPLVPRPAVLPLPAAMPRPTRVFARVRAFGRPQVVQLHRVSSAAVSGSSSTSTRKRTCADHPARRVVVRHHDGVADPVQAERPDRRRDCGRCG